MVTTWFPRFAAAALLLTLTNVLPAQAGTVSVDDRSAILDGTVAYFSALENNDPSALDPIIAPSYKLILPSGRTLPPNWVVQFNEDVVPGTVHVREDFLKAQLDQTGDTIVVQIPTHIWAKVSEGHADVLTVRNSEHRMTWVQSNGKWQLAEDHLLSSQH